MAPNPHETLAEKDIETKVYGLVGIWMETFLYGIYLFLFVAAMRVLCKKQALQRFSSKVFFTGIVVMFILVTMHNGLNIYRLVAGFGRAPTVHYPVQYLTNFLQWENYSLSVLLALIFWTGDTLVIYRCFLIWQRNYWIIALPLALSLASAATHTISLWSARHFSPPSNPSTIPPTVLSMLFPLYAAQNIVTTSLVILRIFLAHRESKRSGTVALNTTSLVLVMRIVVESAAIYTTEIVLAFVFGVLLHPARLLILYLLTPSTGIAFVLLVLRAHAAGEDAKGTLASPSLLPSWNVQQGETATSSSPSQLQQSSSDVS